MTTKRCVAALCLCLASLCAHPAKAETFVLVHGGWGGGWSFRAVAVQLRAQGHDVYRPTLTGLGEREHLRRADTSLETHIQDVINVLEFEQLEEIVLVGHSYGGMVMTGVADRVPQRISRLVYVEGLVPADGESVLDIHRPAALAFEKLRRGDIVTHPGYRPDAPRPQPVPQPVRTLTDKIRLARTDEALPARYILTFEAGLPVEDDPFFAQAQRARARGWEVIEIEGDHNLQRSQPDALVELLTQHDRDHGA